MTQYTIGDFKIVSEETLNSTVKKAVYDAIQSECHQKNKDMVECEDSVIDTKISERRIGKELVIEVMIPEEPSEYIVNEAKITLKQLLLSLTSTFGTFFGLSLFGLCFFLWSDSSWPSNKKKLNVALSTVLVALRIKKQAARNRQDIEMGEIAAISGTNREGEPFLPPPHPSTSRSGGRRMTDRTEDTCYIVPYEIQVQIEQQWESIDTNKKEQVEMNKKLKKNEKEHVELNKKLDQMMADLKQNLELKLSNQIESVKLQTERHINLMGQQFIEKNEKEQTGLNKKLDQMMADLALNLDKENVDLLLSQVEEKLTNQIEAVKLQTEQQINLMGQQFIENVNVIRPLPSGHRSDSNSMRANDQDTKVNQHEVHHRECSTLAETVHKLETSHNVILNIVEGITTIMREDNKKKKNEDQTAALVANQVLKLGEGMKEFWEQLEGIMPQIEKFGHDHKLDRELFVTVFKMMRLHHVNLDMLNEITRCQPPSIGSVIHESADSSTSQGPQDSNEVVSDSELGAVGGQEWANDAMNIFMVCCN